MANFVPNTYLIQIMVTGGKPVVTLYKGDGNNLSGSGLLKVQVGDRIAWRVSVLLASGTTYPASVITFSDSSFFGRETLTIPASSGGSASEFLPVLSPSGKSAYSLNIAGVGCVFDPEIQSGGGGTFIINDLGSQAKAVESSDFVVTFDTTPVSPTLKYQSRGGPPQDFGTMPVGCQNTVTFIAITRAGGVVSDFTINFPPFPPFTNLWPNPFNTLSTLTANPGAPNAIGQETVNDSADQAGTTFQFNASISVDGVTFTSDPRGTYQIQLVTTCP